jgi:hypothetical protein
MEFAYRPEAWETMFEMVALAAVTLTGLLFVGLSINLRSIVATPTHFARAREALIAQLVLLISHLRPDSGRGGGARSNSLAVSIIVLVVGLMLQSSTVHHLPAQRRRAWELRLIVLNSATVAIGIAGVGLIMKGLGGLLWLVPTILICLLWSTYNAWSLTIRGMETNS